MCRRSRLAASCALVQLALALTLTLTLTLTLLASSAGARRVRNASRSDPGSWFAGGMRPGAPGEEPWPAPDAAECARLGLSAGQTRLCAQHGDHMPALARGAREAILECAHQFRARRWNCTAGEDSGSPGSATAAAAATATATAPATAPLARLGSREAAFTHAALAAGAALWVARACRDGRLASCGCSRAPRPRDLHRDWLWGGCGDNLEYGYKFTENFVDSRERETRAKRGSRRHARALMNRHNNEAGRRAVIKKSRVTCKCHGVSGSCSLITCWQQLAAFREIGDHLRDKYDGATEVRASRRGRLQVRDVRHSVPGPGDLVYLAESPNYCVADARLGSPGTAGRACNRTSLAMDGCDLLCCGRGYNTLKVTVRERCHCEFHWCCRVECKTCVRTQDLHTCK